MKKHKKRVQKWINALRSGNYKQTKNCLQDENGFCCLGVACKVFSSKYKKDGDGFLAGSLPLNGYGSPQWLIDIDHDFQAKTKVFLSTLNDNKTYKMSFNEIADLLQMVYIEGVLDNVEN